MHAWFTMSAWLNCKSEGEENEDIPTEIIVIFIDDVLFKRIQEEENNTKTEHMS